MAEGECSICPSALSSEPSHTLKCIIFDCNKVGLWFIMSSSLTKDTGAPVSNIPLKLVPLICDCCMMQFIFELNVCWNIELLNERIVLYEFYINKVNVLFSRAVAGKQLT